MDVLIMNIETVMEFFYERASKRIKEKVEKSGKKHAEIYINDPKQISRIINNRRTRINRFLITDAIISSTTKKDDETKYIKTGLLHELDFKTEKEILWGDDEEIKAYLPDLFKLLWDELPDKDSEYHIDKNFILCDYVPYAENRTYWDLLFSPENKYPAFLYGISEDNIVNNYEKVEQEAFDYLYSKCAKHFEEKFDDFSSKTKSFHKINKVFKENFIDTAFTNLIKQNMPDEYSLGVRVRRLIENDLSQTANLIYMHKENGSIDEIKRALINASSSYVLKLKEIQKNMLEN